MKLPGILLYVLILLAACKKDNGNCRNTQEDIAGNYRFSKITLQAGTGSENDITATDYQPCERDDIYTFNFDGTYNKTDAGTLCGNGNSKGTWQVIANQFQWDGVSYAIVKFDCYSLTISKSYTDAGINYLKKIYFIK